MCKVETGSNGAKSVEEVEVVAKAERRRFTAEYKLRVLQEAARCKQPGEIGALLRREGLYWSNLITWRKQRQNGELTGLRGKRRGPKRRAERAEGIVELQKKVSEILGIDLQKSAESN